jgi:hypothetical protein
MAKRFTCWVIVSGGQPTAFRSHDPEALLPTLKQLQRTQPDSMLRWFERGKLWTSPAEAAFALRAKRRPAESRGRDWRPGGTHADPRAKYRLTRDQKRARFKQRQRRNERPKDEPKGAAPGEPTRPGRPRSTNRQRPRRFGPPRSPRPPRRRS